MYVWSLLVHIVKVESSIFAHVLVEVDLVVPAYHYFVFKLEAVEHFAELQKGCLMGVHGEVACVDEDVPFPFPLHVVPAVSV